MTAPEFPRLVDRRSLPGDPLKLAATPDECAALARRFDLVAVESLTADIAFTLDGPVAIATGTLKARIVQSCAISGEDLPQRINEAVSLRFVPAGALPPPAEEIEITAEDCDEIAYAGTQFDLGEALAQTLALAIDPFAAGPEAERARAAAGLGAEGASGPFAALASLKGKT